MALTLSELLKKAKEKGIEITSPSPTTPLTRPWQEESILFKASKPGNNQGTTREQLNNNINVSHQTYEGNTQNQGTTREHKKILDPEKLHNQAVKVRTREQPGNNKGTTRDRTRDQQENNRGTNREQRENSQGNNEGTTREQRENDPGNDRGNELGNKSPQEITYVLNNLTGLQKRLFDYILETCISREESNTGPLPTSRVSAYLNCSYESTKIILKRLISKGLILRLKGKGCRGGFIILEIPKVIKEIALNKKRSVFIMMDRENDPGNDRGNDPGNDPGNTHDSSSSIINTTTTVMEDNIEINVEPLKDIGFTKAHLKQLLDQNKISATILQNSIDAFAFDLEYNNKSKSIKGTPLNFFMGILKNGKPYLPSGNFETPQDRAMRLYLEQMKEIESQREQREKELKETEFRSWDASLTEEEKENLLPPELKTNKMQAPKLAFRRQFHQDNIWPKKRELIVKSWK